MSAAPPAMADAPAVPVLVGPADGSTAAVDVPLSVRASDADGGSLDVRFVGRKVGATVPGGGHGGPFTVVALPDTQNYTYGGRQAHPEVPQPAPRLYAKTANRLHDLGWRTWGCFFLPAYQPGASGPQPVIHSPQQ